MKLVTFDIETRLGPEDLDSDRERGWEKLRNGEGGISAICIYDDEENWLYNYDDHSIESAARHLEASDLIVGFYTEKFDVPCFEGVLGRKLAIKSHYDIYTEIAAANARKGRPGRRGENTLDAVCRRTIGRGKNNHGSHVKDLIKESRYGELFNYCANDVKLTYDLFMFILDHGGVQGINNSFLPVHIPEWIKEALS